AAAAFLVAVGVAFALLWLAEDIPAVLTGPSPALAETGLFTNPVHVIDLSFVLPAFLVAAVQLWRRRSDGFLYAPVLLAFGAVMAASIAGMMVVIRLSGGVAPIAVIAVMTAVTIVATAMWCWTARRLHGAHATP
ncbi:MAG: hypothetical protein HOV81_22420, partial [Kofleriaceae bacterium]|nr:hypothetical protein [Kofleriaceae bacterium]